eukprot:3831573-Rhodomonas_salina.1
MPGPHGAAQQQSILPAREINRLCIARLVQSVRGAERKAFDRTGDRAGNPEAVAVRKRYLVAA